MPDDVKELHQELHNEFYHYADKRGLSYFTSGLLPMYWRSRGTLLAAAAAGQPGRKFLVATDDATDLTNLVRRALMFSEHVIIAHRSFLPPTGVMLGAIPADFAGFGPLAWIERNKDQLREIPVVPHYQAAPIGDEVTPFLEWLCGEGRSWATSGMVTYAPNVVPADVRLALLNEDVNLSTFFNKANVLPSEDRLVNWKVSAALAQLQIPYLHEVTPEVLRDFKGQEAETVGRFQRHLAGLIDAVNAEVGSPEFSREISLLSGQLADDTATLERAIDLHAKQASWRRIGVELLGLTAGVFFLLDLPQAALGTLGASAVAAASAMKEGIGSSHSLKDNPVSALAALGKVNRRPKRWLPTISKPK